MAEPGVPPVAAVVLNWNGLEDTRRCLASLLAPGGPDRVVVIDNGSANGEAAVLAGEHRGDPRVEVVPLPRNTGFAAGVNEGVRRAAAAGAGLFLLFNNDAVLLHGALRPLRDALAGDPSAAAAGPRILFDDGSRRAWFAGGSVVRPFAQVRHEGYGRPADGLPGETAPTGFLTFCAVLLRREAWEAVGPLDEEYFAYFEDLDWCDRARERGLGLLHCPAAEVLHRGSAAAGFRSPLQAYLLARGRVLFARKRLGAAGRFLLFWPYALLVRAPHDVLRALFTGKGRAARATLRGLLDGCRGGPPRGMTP